MMLIGRMRSTLGKGRVEKGRGLGGGRGRGEGDQQSAEGGGCMDERGEVGQSPNYSRRVWCARNELIFRRGERGEGGKARSVGEARHWGSGGARNRGLGGARKGAKQVEGLCGGDVGQRPEPYLSRVRCTQEG